MHNNTVDTSMGTWGIVLNPTKRYNIAFDHPFHLKQAVLDFNGFMKQELHFRVVLADNNDDRPPITVCILGKQSMMQVQLDLSFEKGDNVSFFVKTDSYNMDVHSFTVHLSGVTARDGDEVFHRQPTALSSPKIAHLTAKPRSISLPDECLQKRGIQSPTKKSTPSPISATEDVPKSPLAREPVAEVPELQPPASPPPMQVIKMTNKIEHKKKRNGVFAAIGQLFSTRESGIFLVPIDYPNKDQKK